MGDRMMNIYLVVSKEWPYVSLTQITHFIHQDKNVQKR